MSGLWDKLISKPSPEISLFPVQSHALALAAFHQLRKGPVSSVERQIFLYVPSRPVVSRLRRGQSGGCELASRSNADRSGTCGLAGCAGLSPREVLGSCNRVTSLALIDIEHHYASVTVPNWTDHFTRRACGLTFIYGTRVLNQWQEDGSLESGTFYCSLPSGRGWLGHLPDNCGVADTCHFILTPILSLKRGGERRATVP